MQRRELWKAQGGGGEVVLSLAWGQREGQALPQCLLPLPIGSRFCKRPLQPPFLFTVPHSSREAEAHKALTCQWSHRKVEVGGDSNRSHKLFATKSAFSHTQLSSGRVTASPCQKEALCPAVLLSPRRAFTPVVCPRCALYVSVFCFSGKAKIEQGQNSHITTQGAKKISLFFWVLLWSPGPFGA